jgi:hypothetical protein
LGSKEVRSWEVGICGKRLKVRSGRVFGVCFVKKPRIKKTYPCHFDQREKSLEVGK